MAASYSSSYGTIYFPPDLEAESRPVIQFRCNKSRPSFNDTFQIFLPLPENLSFQDAATYNDAELGAAVGAGLGVAGAAKSGGMSAATDYVKNNLPSSLGDLAQLVSAASPLSDNVKSAVSIGLGTTLNKNITTEFTGMSTRRFQFAFKFMAKSKKDSETIRNIVRAFRVGLYAEGTALQLQYPPTWSISFLHQSGKTLEYIPKIYECYMDGFSSAYNQSTNLWFSDGAPLECDITMSFIETRALTAQDIADLDKAPFTPGTDENVTGVSSAEANEILNAFGVNNSRSS